MLLCHKRSRRPRKPSRSRSLHCPMPPTPKTHRSLERALPSPERGIARPDAASDAPRNRPPPKRGWTGSRRCGPTATTSRPIANSTPVVGPRVGVPINTCGSGRAARRLRRGNRRHGRRREEPGVIVAELRDQPGQGVVQFDGLVRTGCQQSRGRQEIPVPRRIEGIAFASMRSSSRSSTSRATPLTTRSSTGAGDVTTVKSVTSIVPLPAEISKPTVARSLRMPTYDRRCSTASRGFEAFLVDLRDAHRRVIGASADATAAPCSRAVQQVHDDARRARVTRP